MFISMFVSYAQILRCRGPDPTFIFQDIVFEMFNFVEPALDWWRSMLLLPPPQEFRKIILSKRGFQAASFNRCLQYVRRGVSLWQPVTYVTILNFEKRKLKVWATERMLLI